ncbi:RidA family protein [Marinobacter pelagius]|uniref:RidA family protein n=1 Tax=Marinobacter sp. C7 TaxID=2951363 RepID=UPI001EF13810|nr:RidA family protein [Marinobacter sp. C7]MCG7200741.1 RidA family protein [Marinobacter sp. C7]
MIKTVKTDLYQSPSPLEWATIGNGILFTAQIPIDDQGKVVPGGIEAQTHQTMRNLCHTIDCANASLTDVTQVMIYVTDRAYLPTVNKIYAEYFKEPYPNRAAVVVAGLAREEIFVELVVYAAISK